MFQVKHISKRQVTHWILSPCPGSPLLSSPRVYWFGLSPCFLDSLLYALLGLLVFATLWVSVCITDLVPCLSLYRSSFSTFFMWELRLLIWNFSFFLTYACCAISVYFLSLLYLCPTNFDMWYFHFYLLFFKVSLGISSLTHWLFKSMLFSFRVFGDFSVVFSYFSFDSIQAREHSLYDFSSFKIIDLCFMSQDVLYLGICFMDTCNKSVFYSC